MSRAFGRCICEWWFVNRRMCGGYRNQKCRKSKRERRMTRGRAKRDSREIKNTSVFDCTTFNRVRSFVVARPESKGFAPDARLLEKIRRASARLARRLLLAYSITAMQSISTSALSGSVLTATVARVGALSPNSVCASRDARSVYVSKG